MISLEEAALMAWWYSSVRSDGGRTLAFRIPDTGFMRAILLNVPSASDPEPIRNFVRGRFFFFRNFIRDRFFFYDNDNDLTQADFRFSPPEQGNGKFEAQVVRGTEMHTVQVPMPTGMRTMPDVVTACLKVGVAMSEAVEEVCGRLAAPPGINFFLSDRDDTGLGTRWQVNLNVVYDYGCAAYMTVDLGAVSDNGGKVAIMATSGQVGLAEALHAINNQKH